MKRAFTIGVDTTLIQSRVGSTCAPGNAIRAIAQNGTVTCELDDAYILVYEKKISNVKELVPLLEAVVNSGKPLLIVCEEVEGEALATLVINRLRGTFQVCAV